MFWGRISEEDARADSPMLRAEQEADHGGEDGEPRVEVIDNYKQRKVRFNRIMSAVKENATLGGA
eukprot:9481817-Pyramimonas_sp.AAC.1